MYVNIQCEWEGAKWANHAAFISELSLASILDFGFLYLFFVSFEHNISYFPLVRLQVPPASAIYLKHVKGLSSLFKDTALIRPHER